MDSYFPNKVHQQLIKEPLVILEKAEIYDVIARLHGGGVTGQAGALRLAIARALIELDNPRGWPRGGRPALLTRPARHLAGRRDRPLGGHHLLRTQPPSGPATGTWRAGLGQIQLLVPAVDRCRAARNQLERPNGGLPPGGTARAR